VPVLEGMPAGWKGVEQAYGPASKLAGQTYVRYFSLDGRHKGVQSPKLVIQKHCEDHGLEFDVEYAKYTQAMVEKKAKEGEERAKKRGARGQVEGEKRQEMIVLSRERFGELEGKVVFGFPGWKCRFDYSASSGQTTRTFLAPDGREWKLLKDVECMFGTRIQQGSPEEIEAIAAMVEAGRNNPVAHGLFPLGPNAQKKTAGHARLTPQAQMTAWVGTRAVKSRHGPQRPVQQCHLRKHRLFSSWKVCLTVRHHPVPPP